MPPTVILIRHAEALHNVLRDFTIPDPPLTELGRGPQCADLELALQALPLAQEIGLVVVSPLQRTLQTANESLSWLVDAGVPVIPLAEFQETTINAIDIGQPLEHLVAAWPRFDWSHMDSAWPAKTGLYEYSQAAVEARGRAAKTWLRGRKEKVVAVVSHDNFMRVAICQRMFGNADFRVFEFGEDDDGLALVELEWSERNGGGRGTCPKGVFSWRENDLKYMPKKQAE